MIELTHVDVQDLAIFRTAGWILRPHRDAQLLSRNVRAPAHCFENALLDRRQPQAVWNDRLTAGRTDFGFGLHDTPSLSGRRPNTMPFTSSKCIATIAGGVGAQRVTSRPT